MRRSAQAFLCFVAAAMALSHGWLGIKSPNRNRPEPPPPQAAPKAAAKPVNDTIRLSRKVESIPADGRGSYLGNLEGIRCFNCDSNLVRLDIGNPATGQSSILSLYVEVWNAIERPLKDRRLFEVGNRCVYFGYKEKDTAFVAGEWTEIRVQEVPCYPYVQRKQSPSTATVPSPLLPEEAVPPRASLPSEPGDTASASEPARPAPPMPIASASPAASPVFPGAAPRLPDSALQVSAVPDPMDPDSARAALHEIP
jgi:hypothetical protein